MYTQHYGQSSAGLKLTAVLLGLVLSLCLGVLTGLLLAGVLDGASLAGEPGEPATGPYDFSQYSHRIERDLPDNLTDEDLEGLEEIYDHLRESYDGQLSYNKILDSMKKGLVISTGDPHSQYHTPEEALSLSNSLRGRLIGIGAELTTDEQGRVVVVAPIRGSPAEEAGLRSRDIITAVDGQPVINWDLARVVSSIRGDAGTSVTLDIQRTSTEHADREERLQLTIVRAEISLSSVAHEIRDDIGILTITRFQADEADGEQTVELAVKAARAFRQAGVKGVVLDLRSNPGGVLESTRGIGGLWLTSDQVVTRVGATGGDRRQLTAVGETPPLLQDIPLIALMDGGSASASEIILGMIRDYELGRLVGAASYGKDSVQNLLGLDAGGLLRLTTSHWYTPDGSRVAGGLEPDINISDDPDTDRDEQMDRALQLLR